MSYIFFDTETNGLPEDAKIGAHRDPDSWPELVQIAWILTDDDFNTLAQKSYIIYPEGWRVSKTSTEIHGISNAQAMQEGTDLKEVLTDFEQDYLKAELAICHNLAFDENVLVAAFARAGMKSPIKKIDRLCTMRISSQYVGIENNWGKYKWPKLSELYYRATGKHFKETHKADNDVKGLVDAYKAMIADSSFIRREPYFVPTRKMALNFYKDIPVIKSKKRHKGQKNVEDEAPGSGFFIAIVVMVILFVLFMLIF